MRAVESLGPRSNPFALSLNENPFPPLPSVRSALAASLDTANRYPEFLPERLRSLIAGRVGVRDDQVVIGAGATGVVVQVLHAVTEPRRHHGDDVARPSTGTRSSRRWRGCVR